MGGGRFTPGPWESAPQKGQPGHCVIAQIFAPDGKALAFVEPRDREKEANAIAHLIAAAPEMYAALKAVVGYFEPGDGCFNAEYAQIMAALAKAEGRDA